MNILEEFWYGNIEPAEYDTSSSKEYKKLLQLISRNEDKLLATMTEDQKELFTKYVDCVREFIAYNDTLSCVQWCAFACKCVGDEMYEHMMEIAAEQKAQK